MKNYGLIAHGFLVDKAAMIVEQRLARERALGRAKDTATQNQALNALAISAVSCEP